MTAAALTEETAMPESDPSGGWVARLATRSGSRQYPRGVNTANIKALHDALDALVAAERAAAAARNARDAAYVALIETDGLRPAAAARLGAEHLDETGVTDDERAQAGVSESTARSAARRAADVRAAIARQPRT